MKELHPRNPQARVWCLNWFHYCMVESSSALICMGGQQYEDWPMHQEEEEQFPGIASATAYQHWGKQIQEVTRGDLLGEL